MPLNREEMIMLGRGAPRRPKGKGVGSFIVLCVLLVILGAGGYLLYSYFSEDIHNWFTSTFTQEETPSDSVPLGGTPATGDTSADGGTIQDIEEGPTEELFPIEKPGEGAQAVTSPETTQIIAKWKEVDALEKAGNNAKLEELLLEIKQEYAGTAHEGLAIYRLGWLRQRQGQEEEALELWKQAYEKFGSSWGGRLSALVLADIWYERYCSEQAPVYENWEVVRNAYSTAIGMDKAKLISPADKARIIQRLNKLNARLVFSTAPCKDAEYYTVRENDNLANIAKRFEVHYDCIIAINRLPGNYIRPGQNLKIIRFSSVLTKAVIDKSAMTLTLYHNGKWLKQYPICHGGDKTIPGNYTITIKAPNPQWTDPATNQVYDSNNPKNILGSRWIGFNGTGPSTGIGIHGTTLPESIPGTTSNGCIRMHNKDVEEVYGILIVGSEARILE
ncbi:MAG: L,D-transpeptidase family protein [Planctomycetes bacterium]|nr:L,D-transpeptidase family protein [Planctomycetota bacterium]